MIAKIIESTISVHNVRDNSVDCGHIDNISDNKLPEEVRKII